MGALKSAMFDIGYTAEEIGIPAAAQKYSMSEDDVKMCIMFVNSFDGTWEDYIQYSSTNGPVIH